MASTVTTTPSGRARTTARPDGGVRRRGFTEATRRTLPLAPAVVLLVVFMAGPILWSLYSSFTNTALTGPNAQNPQWIGLDNYARLLNDPVFPRSVWLTVVFVLVSAVFGQNVMGMALAMLMRTGQRVVSAITGTVVVTAWVLPEIVAAFAMYAFFVGGGTLNQILAVVGLDGPNWLFTMPMAAIILANVWRGTAFSMLVYRAALDDVSQEVTEAAELDGANAAQRLFRVTLPIIKSSISTNLMLITLQTLSVFTLVFVMTAGGPGNASMTLPILAYEQAFGFLNIGYGSAIATVMLIVGTLFAAVYVRLLAPRKER